MLRSSSDMNNNKDDKAPATTSPSSSWTSFRNRWSWKSSSTKDTSAPPTDQTNNTTTTEVQQSSASLPEDTTAARAAASSSTSSSSKWSFRQMWASSSANNNNNNAPSQQPTTIGASQSFDSSTGDISEGSTSFDLLMQDEELDITNLVPGVVSITVRQSAGGDDNDEGHHKFWWKLELEKKVVEAATPTQTKDDDANVEEVEDSEEPKKEDKDDTNDNKTDANETAEASSSASADPPPPQPQPQIVITDWQSDSSLQGLPVSILQPGDVLTSFNYCECHEMDVKDIHALLDDSGGGLVTLVAARPGGDPRLVQAWAVTFHATYNSNVQGEEDELTTGLSFANRQPPKRSRLRQRSDGSAADNNKPCGVVVSDKSMDGFLAHSALECKDRLVAIQGMNCWECSADEAELLLNSKFWGADTVSVLAKRSSQDDDASKGWTVRKAAVAAAGGTMVTVGAVVMATPLHPVGHAMALGGVAVLGTEFEAPKRAMESARKSFNSMYNRSKDEEEEGDATDKAGKSTTNPFVDEDQGPDKSANNDSNNPFDEDDDDDNKTKKVKSSKSTPDSTTNPFAVDSEEEIISGPLKQSTQNTNPFDSDDNDDEENRKKANGSDRPVFRQQTTSSSNPFDDGGMSDVSLGTNKDDDEKDTSNTIEQRQSWKEQFP